MTRLKIKLRAVFDLFKPLFNLQYIEGQMTVLSSLLIKAITVTGLVLLISLLLRAVTDTSYIIQSFQVPDQLQHSGYTSIVVSNSIRDKINDLENFQDKPKKKEQSARDLPIEREIFDETINKEKENALNIDIAGLGVNINNILGLGRHLFGVNQNSISGEVIMIDSSLILNLRVSGHPSFRIAKRIINNNFQQAYDSLVHTSAEYIIKKVKPINYVYYAYKTRRFDEANKSAINLLKGSKTERKHAYNVLGLIAMERKLYELALLRYNSSLEVDRSFSLVYNNIGICLKKQRKYDSAAKVYKRAIAISPKEASFKSNLGICLATQADSIKDTSSKHILYQEAIKQFHLAVEQEPNNTSYYRSLATTLRKIKNYSEARRIYNKCLMLESENAKTYNNIAVVYQYENKLDSSIVFANKSLQIDSTYGYAYSTLAENYALKKNDSLFLTYILLALKNKYPKARLRTNSIHKNQINALRSKYISLDSLLKE